MKPSHLEDMVFKMNLLYNRMNEIIHTKYNGAELIFFSFSLGMYEATETDKTSNLFY